MSNETRKNLAPVVDGFDDEAGDQQFARVIQGEKWQFNNDSTWTSSDEEEIPPDREVVVVDIARVVQKWIEQKPVETRFLAPGEKTPDIQQLNEACPQTEWSEDLNGRPRGPWQLQNVVYLVDLQSMQKSTFPTGTVGGSICVSELRDAVKLMRRFRGPGVYPVVSPSNKHMNTRFGGRQRPHFTIKRWIAFGPEGMTLPATAPPALPGPDRAVSGPPGTAKNNSGALPSGAHVVEQPTVAEELDDKIPW